MATVGLGYVLQIEQHCVLGRRKLTFVIAGAQKKSEATLLHVRIDGVVRARSFSTPTVWSAEQGNLPYRSVEQHGVRVEL